MRAHAPWPSIIYPITTHSAAPAVCIMQSTSVSRYKFNSFAPQFVISDNNTACAVLFLWIMNRFPFTRLPLVRDSVVLLCRTAVENKFEKHGAVLSGWAHMHKQLRLKSLKNKQMGSIFHLWICFIGCDEYEMPECSTSAGKHSCLSVSNDLRMGSRFFTQQWEIVEERFNWQFRT